MTQHIDEEMQETEVCEVDPHDCHALVKENLRLKRRCTAWIAISTMLIAYLLIFIVARFNQ
tara:strand:- start:2801 stop:2983 length:183 start_codon:yes stop_codon:yes gene_type:complete